MTPSGIDDLGPKAADQLDGRRTGGGGRQAAGAQTNAGDPLRDR